MSRRIARKKVEGHSGHSVVYMTTKDEDEAKRIIKRLMGKRLIACANMFPIRSIYRWKGNIADGEEVGVLVKTRSSLVSMVVREVRLGHSYDVPCVISFKIENGNEDFLRWIDDETTEG